MSFLQLRADAETNVENISNDTVVHIASEESVNGVHYETPTMTKDQLEKTLANASAAGKRLRWRLKAGTLGVGFMLVMFCAFGGRVFSYSEFFHFAYNVLTVPSGVLSVIAPGVEKILEPPEVKKCARN